MHLVAAAVLLWEEVLRVEQIFVDFVKRLLVVADVSLFNGALVRWCNLHAERVNSLALQLTVENIDFVDLLADLFALLVKARFFGFDSVGLAFSLVDLVRNGLFDLLEQVSLFLLQFDLLTVNLSGFALGLILLRLDLLLDKGICLFIRLVGIQFFDEFLGFHLQLQLDHSLLQLIIVRILVLYPLLRSHNNAIKLPLLLNQ